MNAAAFVLTRLSFSCCIDDTNNSLSISRGTLAPGSYPDLYKPRASALRLMNLPPKPPSLMDILAARH